MRTMIAGIVVLVATTSASADEPYPPTPVDPTRPALPEPQPPPAPTTPTTVAVNIATPVVMPETRPVRWYETNRLGLAMTIGGGVQGFTGDVMRGTTRDGGNWDVRAMLGTNMPLTIEASYLGSVQSINALGLDNKALLVGNGVQADLRLNATTGIPVQPFIYGGVAWRRYSIENTDFNTSDVLNRDDVVEIPVGLGVAYKTRGFLLDARAEFRGSFNENLMPGERSAFTTPANLDRWGINANAGFEF